MLPTDVDSDQQISLGRGLRFVGRCQLLLGRPHQLVCWQFWAAVCARPGELRAALDTALRGRWHDGLAPGRNTGTSRGRRSDVRTQRGRWKRVLRREGYSPSPCCTRPGCCTRWWGLCGCPPAQTAESLPGSFASLACQTFWICLSFGFTQERRATKGKEMTVGWSAKSMGRNVPHCSDVARTRCLSSCVSETTTLSTDEPGQVGRKLEVLLLREVPDLYRVPVWARAEPGWPFPSDNCRYLRFHTRPASSRWVRFSPSPGRRPLCTPRIPPQKLPGACLSRASLENSLPRLLWISCGTDSEAI